MAAILEPAPKKQKTIERVEVLGAGFSGLTTAAELALRGYRVRVISKDFGYCPPITIVGTQSRRHPGIAYCNRGFDKELVSINRFLALAAQNPESGVSVIPALKVSRKEGVWWNPRPLDAARKAKATEVQNCLRLAVEPNHVEPSIKERLFAVGYKSVDETQVIKVESRKYFDFLVKLIKDHGGCVCMGCNLDAEAVANMSGLAVVNCLGLAAGKVGGNEKEYENNPGEEVIFHKSPCSVPFYIIDDDTSGTIVQGSDGQLCLSSGAKPKNLLSGSGGYDSSCTKQTVEDAELIQMAIFGDARKLRAEDVSESWATDRPSLGTGFNIGAARRDDGRLVVQNSGHGGAGVTASWACAILAADAFECALKDTTASAQWASTHKETPHTKEGAVELYDKWASSYDETLQSWGYVSHLRVAEHLSKFALDLNVSKDHKVLDAGCGTGLSGEALKAQGFPNLVGADCSAESLKLLESKNIYARLEDCDLEGTLPFEKNEFGFVTCVGVLSYIHNFRAIFSEWCRVTQPGGLIVFTHREDLWGGDVDSVKSVADELEKTGLWQQVLVAEPSYSMPNKPTDKPMKRIHYVVYKITSS